MQTVPTLKYSTLSIDGVEYRLAYDFGAIISASKEIGVNLLDGLVNLTRLQPDQLSGLLYAALKPLQPGMTPQKAVSLICIDTLHPIMQAIAEAYRLSTERPKADPPKAALVRRRTRAVEN